MENNLSILLRSLVQEQKCVTTRSSSLGSHLWPSTCRTAARTEKLPARRGKSQKGVIISIQRCVCAGVRGVQLSAAISFPCHFCARYMRCFYGDCYIYYIYILGCAKCNKWAGSYLPTHLIIISAARWAFSNCFARFYIHGIAHARNAMLVLVSHMVFLDLEFLQKSTRLPINFAQNWGYQICTRPQRLLQISVRNYAICRLHPATTFEKRRISIHQIYEKVVQ